MHGTDGLAEYQRMASSDTALVASWASDHGATLLPYNHLLPDTVIGRSPDNPRAPNHRFFHPYLPSIDAHYHAVAHARSIYDLIPARAQRRIHQARSEEATATNSSVSSHDTDPEMPGLGGADEADELLGLADADDAGDVDDVEGDDDEMHGHFSDAD